MHRILVSAVLAVGAVFVGLTLMIVVNKAWREARNRWRRVRRWRLEPRVLAFVHRSEPSLLGAIGGRVRAADRGVLEDILLSLVERVRGSDRERLQQGFDELGFVNRYLARLGSPRWWRRAEAAEKLGLAGAKRATDALVIALQDDSSEVRIRAAKALGIVGGSAAMRPLILAMSEPNRWSTIRIADVLAGMGHSVVDELVAAFASLNVHAKLAALDILGRVRALHAAPWIRERLEDPEPDVRARACHALGAIGDPDAGPFLVRALQDAEWPARAMAAKALGRVRYGDAIAQLCEAMRDPEWWVRANAAEAVRVMGNAGIDALARMLDDQDNYARHQAVLMLEESGVIDEKVGQLSGPDEPQREAAEGFIRRFIRAGQMGRLHELAGSHRDSNVRRALEKLMETQEATR